MSGMIEVLQPGFGVTVQDAGRLGHRHEGVPRSGWLDAPLAQPQFPTDLFDFTRPDHGRQFFPALAFHLKVHAVVQG